jgi:hypothetical protein
VKCVSGTVQWEAGYNGPASMDDVAEDVVATASAIYVGGWSQNHDGGDEDQANDTVDMALQKYSPDSNVALWTRRVASHPLLFGIEKPVHVGLDDSGNVYLAGAVYISLYDDYRFYLVGFDSNGSQLPYTWTGGRWSGGQEAELRDMVVANGYAYMTGKQTDENGVKMITCKVSLSSWSASWAQATDLSGHDVTGTNLTLDSSGNVYVLGRCTEPTNGNNSLLVKYNGSGEQQWAVTFATSPTGTQALAVDGAGVVVTAQDSSAAQIVTRWFSSSNGSLRGTESYSGHGYPAAVGVDSSNNAYVTGSGRFDASWPSDPDQDIRTLKYTAP